MDHISTVKKGNKNYCLGGVYNVVLNKNDTIGSILDQIPDFNPSLAENCYPVLWSGNAFGISFGHLVFYKESNEYFIKICEALYQEVVIETSHFESLELLRNVVIRDNDIETADRMPMILSDIPTSDLRGKWYDVVFRDGHIMFDYDWTPEQE